MTASVPESRRGEYEAIVVLLEDDAATPQAAEVARFVALGCLDDAHLWRALELGDRGELRRLLETHFPRFAAGNDRDMRWKRYIYKRLCGWPGFTG